MSHLEFNWRNFREFMMLVIGVALVILLINIRAEQSAQHNRGDKTRIIICKVPAQNGLVVPEECKEVLGDN